MNDAIAVPSGQVVTLLDVITDTAGPAGLTVRFRFLAPSVSKVGGSITADVAGGDMDALCQDYALPRVASTGPQPAQIVISMSDIDVPFGESHPEATQLFNSYSIADGLCVWEMF
ncbi:MAG: acetolactate synthase [Candidatus Saccharibacteria bacterium]|nr:acetolactate synthase [Pseudorhodobacter sp.]